MKHAWTYHYVKFEMEKLTDKIVIRSTWKVTKYHLKERVTEHAEITTDEMTLWDNIRSPHKVISDPAMRHVYNLSLQARHS